MTMIPYPLRAARIDLSIAPFSFWWRPVFFKGDLAEHAREAGETIWYARWGWFQISYGRWV